MYNNPYSAYKQMDIETSDKRELVGKLYNEASMSLKRACGAIDRQAFDAANDSITKAEVIVKTLDGSLDMQYEISGQLRSLYRYMYRRMIEANVSKDKEILNQVSGMLSELRDSWNEAVKICKRMQST